MANYACPQLTGDFKLRLVAALNPGIGACLGVVLIAMMYAGMVLANGGQSRRINRERRESNHVRICEWSSYGCPHPAVALAKGHSDYRHYPICANHLEALGDGHVVPLGH